MHFYSAQEGHNGSDCQQKLSTGVHTRDAWFAFSLLSLYLSERKEESCFFFWLPLYIHFRVPLMIGAIQDEPDKTRTSHSLTVQSPSRNIKQALILSTGGLRGHSPLMFFMI